MQQLMLYKGKKLTSPKISQCSKGEPSEEPPAELLHLVGVL